jgi:hypothetical protein
MADSEKALLEKLAGERGRRAWPTRQRLLRHWEGRPEKAQAALEQLKSAVQEDPGHHEAWLALFERARLMGDRELSANALEHAALTAPTATARAQAWEQLGGLRGGAERSVVDAEPQGDPAEGGEIEEKTTPGPEVFTPGPPVRERGLHVSSEDGELAVRCQRELDEAPLEPRPYAALADLLGRLGDEGRARHLRKVASALKGATESSIEVAPGPLLRADRAGLRDPNLRTAEGELVALAAPILLALTEKPSETFPGSAFRQGAGPGAPSVSRALDSAESVLAMSFEHVRISDEQNPAFRFCAAQGIRVEIGRQALREPQPEAKLRFEAGRALMAQTPDLLVLLHLSKDALKTMLGNVERALRRGSRLPLEAERALKRLSERRQKRLLALMTLHLSSLDFSKLKRAARHSTHRAGLAVAGNVAASLQTLRQLGAREEEQARFIRFAASERYYQWRRGQAL